MMLPEFTAHAASSGDHAMLFRYSASTGCGGGAGHKLK
jgi:hypothetical protein